MKSLLFTLIIVGVVSLYSCSKKELSWQQHSFVKAIESDVDVITVGSLQLTDGNYVIVARDINNRNAGKMIKLDVNGKILWEKPASTKTSTLYKIFPVAGKGFALFGFENDGTNLATDLNVCIYNNDGALIDTKPIPTGHYNQWKDTYDALVLSNGNYAFAGSENIMQANGYLIIMNSDFNLVSVRTFKPTSSRFRGCRFRGMCETKDGNIMLTASTENQNPMPDTAKYCNMLIKTTNTGAKQLSSALFADSGYSETSNCLVNYQDGAIGVSARMTGNKGTTVNYLNSVSSFFFWISGQISLCKYDSNGQLAERKNISNYPYNGQISTIKTTSDGGVILCGTVGQLDEQNMSSPTKIYLLKFDANFNQQWTKIIATTYPSYGVDVLQTNDGGYLVSGHQITSNSRFETIVIKTDANGNY